MTDGLNNDLIKNPVSFLRKYMVRSQSHYFFKLSSASGKNELMSGRYTVNLVPANHEPCPSVYLQTRGQWGKRSHKLECFYLSAAPDQVNSEVLPGDVDWFFTDLLTGCQFLAYGNAATPNIEHNNSLNSGSVDYSARVGNATRGGLIARVSPGVQYNPKGGECGTVVGKRSGTSWTFWLQRMDAARKLHVVELPTA